MGQLKPGAKLIYERSDGVVYSREFGADPNTRQIHGWDYRPEEPNYDPRTGDGRPLHDHIMDAKLWGEIRRASRTNPALQNALNQCILIYNLSKEHGT